LPEAVQVTHGELSRLVMAWAGGLALQPEDRALQDALCSSDGSVLEEFATLLRGATLCLVLLGGLFVLDFAMSSWLGSGHRSSEEVTFVGAAPDQACVPMDRCDDGGRGSRVG
jgi:hypothetical protein